MDDPVDCHNDKLFEPTIDMMVNDFDDEQTLEEEENLQSDPNQDQQELDSLQRESEMPIEELMRLYNMPVSSGNQDYAMKPKKPRKKRKHTASLVNNNNPEDEPHQDESSVRKSARVSDELHAEKDDVPSDDVSSAQGSVAEEPAKTPAIAEICPLEGSDEDDDNLEADNEYKLPSVGLFSNSATSAGDDMSSSQPTDLAGDDDDEDLDGPSELVQLLDDVQDDEEEADHDYYPDDLDLKKSILVGENHQAEIPETILPRKECDASAPVSDQLLWSPHSDKVNDGVVERFLAKFYKLRRHLNHPGAQPDVSPEQLISCGQDAVVVTSGVVKDEENALTKLLEADYNVEMALQQVCNLMQSNGELSSDGYCGTVPAVTWTEEECRNFELGIRLYGKNFTLIQGTKVPGRSVQELVQFYYFWKKTERYDSFAAKQRLEKKRHSMCHQNPGLTEFMDRFLEEQQQPRSMSPKQSSVSSAVTQSPPTACLSMAASTVAGNADLLLIDGPGHLMEGNATGVKSGDQRPQSPSTTLLLGGGGDEGVLDGNHSLLIYADSKRQNRTSGGGGAAPTTPPVTGGCSSDARHPFDEYKKTVAKEVEGRVDDMST